MYTYTVYGTKSIVWKKKNRDASTGHISNSNFRCCSFGLACDFMRRRAKLMYVYTSPNSLCGVCCCNVLCSVKPGKFWLSAERKVFFSRNLIEGGFQYSWRDVSRCDRRVSKWKCFVIQKRTHFFDFFARRLSRCTMLTCVSS